MRFDTSVKLARGSEREIEKERDLVVSNSIKTTKLGLSFKLSPVKDALKIPD